MSTPFLYTRETTTPGQRRLQRALEIIPGLSSWTVLISMLMLGLFEPLIAAGLVIAFNLYWFVRLAHSTLFLVLSYLLLRAESKTDWSARLRQLHSNTDDTTQGTRLSRWMKHSRLAQSSRSSIWRSVAKRRLPPMCRLSMVVATPALFASFLSAAASNAVARCKRLSTKFVA